MFVQDLEITNLRILDSAMLVPGQGLNVLYGPNGSGKTSVLEALHLLGVGRSFRSRHHHEMVRRGTQGFRVNGAICRETGVRRLGLEHGPEGLRIRCDGQAVTSASLLAKELPLILLTPESQRLMTEGASLRRQLLDWCLFHVEPGFLPVFKRFRRVLKQRNAALRSQESPRAVRSWDDELIASGNEVHELRARYVDVFLPTVEAIVDRLLPFPSSTRVPGRMAGRPYARGGAWRLALQRCGARVHPGRTTAWRCRIPARRGCGKKADVQRGGEALRRGYNAGPGCALHRTHGSKARDHGR